MSNPIRLSAASGCALALALGLAHPAPAATVGVTPHIFDGGMTLIDLADENLDPWGFYDGTKGMPVPAIASSSETAKPVAVADPVPGGWIAAAGWSAPSPEGVPPAGAPLFAPIPVPAGFPGPRAQSPCFWGDDRFGRVESRDRCGHPVRTPAMAGVQPSFPSLPLPMILDPDFSGSPILPAPDPAVPVAPVPLPATGWLLAAGLLALAARKRR